MNTHISVTLAHYESPCGFTWGSITALVGQSSGLFLGEAEDVGRPLGRADTRLYEWITRKYAMVLQFNLSLPQRQLKQYASLWSMKQLLAKWVQLKRSLVEGFTRDSFHNTSCLKGLASSESPSNQTACSIRTRLWFLTSRLNSTTQIVHW